MIHFNKFSFNDIAKFYSIIRISHMGIASPVECIDDTVSRTWEAPQHPTESGIFISDTIYEEPKTITLNGYIQNMMLPVFEGQILLSIKTGIGFQIYTIGGVYSNMFVTDFNRPESPDVSTGYRVSITFSELQQAGSLLNTVVNFAITAASSAVAAAVNTIDQGSVTPLADGAREIADSALSSGLSLL